MRDQELVGAASLEIAAGLVTATAPSRELVTRLSSASHPRFLRGSDACSGWWAPFAVTKSSH